MVFCSKNSKTEMKQYPRLTFIVLGQAQRKPNSDWMGGNCSLCIVWYLKSTGRLEKSLHQGGPSRIDRWCFLVRCHQTGMWGWDQDHNKMLWLGKAGSHKVAWWERVQGGGLDGTKDEVGYGGGERGWSWMGGKFGAARSPLRRHTGTCLRKRVMSSHREDQTNQGPWQSQPRSLAIPNTSISDLYICNSPDWGYIGC